jgi:hypothetical protein
MARRVDMCIEEAKQRAIECTLDLIPFSGGWGGIGQGFDYLACLEELKRALLECDRQAKHDTNCPDVNTPPDCADQHTPPDGEGTLLAQRSVEDFIESLSTPLQPGNEDERIA